MLLRSITLIGSVRITPLREVLIGIDIGLSKEGRVVGLGVVGTAAKGVVQRILGESLHRGVAAAFFVAVGVAGVEGAVMVEYCVRLV